MVVFMALIAGSQLAIVVVVVWLAARLYHLEKTVATLKQLQDMRSPLRYRLYV